MIQKIYDSSDCESNSPLMNFTNYYFERYYDSLKCYEVIAIDMAYDFYLKNVAYAHSKTSQRSKPRLSKSDCSAIAQMNFLTIEK